MKNTVNQKDSVDQIIDGLEGDLRIGERLYVFTVTYAYIGTVEKVTEKCLTLSDVVIVMNAGSDDDAVSKIVAGKVKPANFERPGVPVRIFLQSIVTVIPCLFK